MHNWVWVVIIIGILILILFRFLISSSRAKVKALEIVEFVPDYQGSFIPSIQHPSIKEIVPIFELLESKDEAQEAIAIAKAQEVIEKARAVALNRARLKQNKLVNVRPIMMITVSTAVLGSALYIILSKDYAEAEQKWAFGAIGTILGYWLKE